MTFRTTYERLGKDLHLAGMAKRAHEGDLRAIRTPADSCPQFLGAFLQRVLPKGFRRIRHYDCMASNSPTTRARVQWRDWLWRGWVFRPGP